MYSTQIQTDLLLIHRDIIDLRIKVLSSLERGGSYDLSAVLSMLMSLDQRCYELATKLSAPERLKASAPVDLRTLVTGLGGL